MDDKIQEIRNHQLESRKRILESFSVSNDNNIEKGAGHKYFKREGTPGNYKYYYTEEEYKQAKGSGDSMVGKTVSIKQDTPTEKKFTEGDSVTYQKTKKWREGVIKKFEKELSSKTKNSQSPSKKNLNAHEHYKEISINEKKADSYKDSFHEKFKKHTGIEIKNHSSVPDISENGKIEYLSVNSAWVEGSEDGWDSIKKIETALSSLKEKNPSIYEELKKEVSNSRHHMNQAAKHTRAFKKIQNSINDLKKVYKRTKDPQIKQKIEALEKEHNLNNF